MVFLFFSHDMVFFSLSLGTLKKFPKLTIFNDIKIRSQNVPVVVIYERRINTITRQNGVVIYKCIQI